MFRLRAVFAWLLLGIGTFLGILLISVLLDHSTVPNSRGSLVSGVILLGVFPSAVGGWLIFQGRVERAKAEKRRLQDIFYHLLRESNGQINVLRFSMQANINGTEAKAFLDERAREFNAAFHVSEDGKVIYYFDGDFDPLPAASGFDVILESYPSQQRDALATLIQAQLSLERRTAKAIVKQAQSFPVTIARELSKSQAHSLKDRLESVGAKILIIVRE